MLRPHERLVGTHYSFHVNNAKHCSLQPSDDGHEPHVGGQAQNPQRQLRPKRTPNAVNGGALLPVLVVRIPTSANMLNTCTPLSNRVGLRSTTSSQAMVCVVPMHALVALSLTITSLTRPRVITRRARCESNRSCACAFTGLAAGRGRGPLPAPFRLLPPRRPSTRQKAADIESAGPPHTRVTPTPTPACTVYPHARACLNPPLAAAHRSFPHMRPTLSLTSTLPSPNPNQARRRNMSCSTGRGGSCHPATLC